MDRIQKSASLPRWNSFEKRATPWRNRIDELHEKAIRAAGGYDDFGDTAYREPFDLLMGCFDTPWLRGSAPAEPAGLLPTKIGQISRF